MKTFISFALIFTTFLAFAKEPRKTLSPQELEQVKKVLEGNDKLFNALLTEKGAEIEKEAQSLLKVVEGSTSQVLKDTKAASKNLKTLKASVKHEDKLKSYEEFVKPLLKVVTDYNVGKNYNLFSCPMVEKSWVQDTRVNSGVKNVFATYMLECGTQDTKF